MTVRLEGSVDVGADTEWLLLIECRVGVVLMNGRQGSLGVFEENDWT